MSDSTKDQKEGVRERLRARRRDLSDLARRRASARVCRRLQRWDRLQNRSVGGYLSFDNEVDVAPFLEDRLDAGRTVALPRVEDDESMHFVDVESLDEVEEGAFGIMEPIGTRHPLAELEAILVPGVGFDRDGGRIGMGWGYYDRALTRRREADSGDDAIFVGICYDCQLVDEPLPTEPHDVSVDAVVTEEELVR